MSFLAAVKMECYKVVNRTSTRVLLLFLILPFFYGIGNLKNSQAVAIDGKFSALTFGSMCWGLLGLTGITNVLFSILIVNYFAREREEGQIKFILLESCSRKKAFWAKCMSVFLLMFLSYIMMYVVSIFVYYTCIAGSEHGFALVGGLDDLALCFFADLLYFVQLLMAVSIQILLCLYYKSTVSLLSGIVLSMIFLVLQYIPIVKLADPLYIVNLFNDLSISTLEVLIYAVIYILLCGLVLVFAEQKFERIEMR